MDEQTLLEAPNEIILTQKLMKNYVDTTKTINHLSLCTGYEGIGTGLRRVLPNVREVAYVEIEAFAIANLVNKMEEGWLHPCPIYTNLKTFPYEEFCGQVDIMSFGFPCQPFSSAGKKRGVEDERHLFPYLAEGIRVMQPRIVLAENVLGILSCKTGEGEPVLQYVGRTLEEMGYTVEIGIFSASEVGLPHQRKRVFICGISNTEIERLRGWNSQGNDVQDGLLPREQEGSEVECQTQGCSRDNAREPNTMEDTNCNSSTTNQGGHGEETQGESQDQPRVQRGMLGGTSCDEGIMGNPNCDGRTTSEGLRSEYAPCSRSEEGQNQAEQSEGTSEPRISTSLRGCEELAHTDSSRSGQDKLSAELWTDRTEQSSSDTRDPEQTEGREGSQEELVNTESECNRFDKTQSQGRDTFGTTSEGVMGNTDCEGLQGLTERQDGEGLYFRQTGQWLVSQSPSRPNHEQYQWEAPRVITKGLSESELGGATDGLADRLDPMLNRTDRLRLLGNGVVPAVAAKAFATLTSKLLSELL